MLLAIDVGNSNIKFGLYSNNSWINRFSIRTVPDKTADEYAVLFRDLLGAAEVQLKYINRCVLSSVVPPVTGTMTDMVFNFIGKDPLVVGPGIRTGIRIRTDNPVELGSDLVAQAAAAYERYHTDCIIVAFGTALTFTAVAEPGDLLGVAIAPGLQYAAEALSQHAAQLRLVELKAPEAAIGRNTVHSIQSGIIFGYVGIVEALIDRMQNELSGKAKIIATGGQSSIIAPLTSKFTEIEPWLTLEGLRIIAERNI